MRVPARSWRRVSLRTKFLAIVLLGAVLPLALLGLWLVRATERAGEALLVERLDGLLQRHVEEIGLRWVEQRSELLRLTEDSSLRRALAGGGEHDERAQVALESIFVALRTPLERAVIRDLQGRERWRLSADDAAGEGGSRLALPVTFDVFAAGAGTRLGTLESHLPSSALLPPDAARGGSVGALLALVDRSSGAPLLPVPLDASLLRQDRFRWGGEEWRVRRRQLGEPAVELIAAAPLTPYTAPFQETGRQGIVALVLVAVFGAAVTLVLTRRLTRSLEALASAADAISRGELGHRVPERGVDEVARVAHAFNGMTESLQHSLAQLAQQQGLAAVGEFAATLSHEVRNPLTSIRIDLQRVAEKLGGDARVAGPLGRALAGVDRLNATVTGALRVARSGRIARESLDLRLPLGAAAHAAGAEFERQSAALRLRNPNVPVPVSGDAAALEQLFLNLLLNAAQALEPGGEAMVEVELRTTEVEVRIRDNGCGIAPEQLARIGEAFVSTKPEGTGLGLAVSKRVAAAHGGSLTIESTPGRGTTVRVRLPIDPAHRQALVASA